MTMHQESVFHVIKRHLLTVVSDLDEGEISTEISMAELGCNSIDRLEVVTATMEELGIVVPVMEFQDVDSLGALTAVLQKWTG